MPRGNVTQLAVKRSRKRRRGRKLLAVAGTDVAGIQPDQYQPLLDHDQQATWGHPLDVKPSDLLPHLNAAERHFFKLVARGDVDGLIYHIKNTEVHINCQDYQGYTPLVIAVKRNDESIVELLLTVPGIVLGDALLHAVQIGNCYIVEMLLDVMKKSGSEMSLPGCVESAEYSPDITPLILAAQCQHYQVVKLLLQRGHAINYPHPPECFCEVCSWKCEGESLTDSRARYHAYQAMASPAYICQSSTDPILTAFLLSRELWRCSKYEMELKTEYRQLSKEVSNVAVDLLHQCRTTREVELLLTRRAAPPGYRSPPDQPFPRVGLAIDCRQKKFIAHPNVQHVLRQKWLGDYQHWRGLTTGGKVLRILPNFFLLPVMALLYIIVPNVAFVKSWKSPVNKFISYMVSYLNFLAIVYIHNEMDTSSYVRGPPDTGLEPIVIIYITSFLWLHVRMCWKQGMAKYFRQNWHRYDLMMMGLFYTAFATWAWAWYDVYMYGHKYVPRRYWHQYDPALVAEAMYSLATISAFGKLLYFFQIGSRLGPLQLSMSRMFKDIFDFLLVFLIVLVSFATGIHKLYTYYRGQVRRLEGEETTQSEAFITFQGTVKNLFWALFGYSPPQYADVVVSEHTYDYDNTTVVVVNKHKFTEAMGYMLYGAYNVASIVILLNLLIAMMSTSFIVVQENADEEWKYARTRVWMMFFEEDGTLPPPFNLIPTPKNIWYRLRWICHRVRGCRSAKYSRESCGSFEENKLPLYTRREYEKVMGQLVQRYLRYSTQMHLREQHLTDSDLQYLLHGIPTTQHAVSSRHLHTSPSSSENGSTNNPNPSCTKSCAEPPPTTSVSGDGAKTETHRTTIGACATRSSVCTNAAQARMRSEGSPNSFFSLASTPRRNGGDTNARRTRRISSTLVDDVFE